MVKRGILVASSVRLVGCSSKLFRFGCALRAEPGFKHRRAPPHTSEESIIEKQDEKSSRYNVPTRPFPDICRVARLSEVDRATLDP